MKRKTLIFLILAIIGIVGITILGSILGAGNYGYAQKYEFDINEKELCRAVNKFKLNNPKFNPPGYLNDSDTLDISTSHYNYFLFYDNLIVGFFIEQNKDDSNKSIVNLVSVTSKNDETNWKLINRDFSRKENLLIKNNFENLFLNKLGFSFNDRGNNNFVFWK